jgi:hypothetical protein
MMKIESTVTYYLTKVYYSLNNNKQKKRERDYFSSHFVLDLISLLYQILFFENYVMKQNILWEIINLVS